VAATLNLDHGVRRGGQIDAGKKDRARVSEDKLQILVDQGETVDGANDFYSKIERVVDPDWRRPSAILSDHASVQSKSRMAQRRTKFETLSDRSRIRKDVRIDLKSALNKGKRCRNKEEQKGRVFRAVRTRHLAWKPGQIATNKPNPMLTVHANSKRV